MSKRASDNAKATPHEHAYGSWRSVLAHTGRKAHYPSVRYCECGAKQVKQSRGE